MSLHHPLSTSVPAFMLKKPACMAQRVGVMWVFGNDLKSHQKSRFQSKDVALLGEGEEKCMLTLQ